jgi:hypothetical protein
VPRNWGEFGEDRGPIPPSELSRVVLSETHTLKCGKNDDFVNAGAPRLGAAADAIVLPWGVPEHKEYLRDLIR